MSQLDIIVVTFNSPEYAVPCVNSILRDYDGTEFFHIYIVNNGEPGHSVYFPKHAAVTVLQQEKNLGWEGGLAAGLEHSQAPYVMFLNDDTFIPMSSYGWLRRMLGWFSDVNCAAVGPSSNVVMGPQNMFHGTDQILKVSFLIGLCYLVRRSDLDAAGGIDATLPGGDDLDLSIRLRKLGKYLLSDKSVFVYHHGFKTGQKVHGSDWNSVAMIERTNHAIMRKHGLRQFLSLWGPPSVWNPDQEGKMIAEMIESKERVLDIGCGTRRTVPWAVTVDKLPKGTLVPNVFPRGESVADVVADVTGPLPFEPDSQDVIIARHVLEHVPDVAATIANWANVLRHGGYLVIAVPDDAMGDTLHMDHDHKQSFTKESLQKTMEDLGWKTKGIYDPKNNMSFIGVWEKNGK